MKSVFLFIGFVFISLSTPDISEVREAYRDAAGNKKKAENLYQKLSPISDADDPLLFGYKGASATLMARYAKGVKAKTGYFKEGKKLIEQAIIAAPNNIELRYIRLSVQENAPKVVRYKKAITEDKQFILEHYPSLKNAAIKKNIKGFVSQSTSFTDTEKQLF